MTKKLLFSTLLRAARYVSENNDDLTPEEFTLINDITKCLNDLVKHWKEIPDFVDPPMGLWKWIIETGKT